MHFPLENIDFTAIFAVFPGKVNHFSANQWHFPPHFPRIRGSRLLFGSCLKFFLRKFETDFRVGFCRFFEENSSAILRQKYRKNSGKMPEWGHKELLKKF
ncbi:hypothetical protein B5F83_01620 [Muribaculum sp. An289]|nr:hypothetical protein B5F83_01620 [Muribaculum sp. An289]